MGSSPGNEMAAGVFVIFRFIDREKLELCFAFDFGRGPWSQFERNAVEVKSHFIARHGLFLSQRVSPDQRAVTLYPGKVAFSNQYATQLVLPADEIKQAELGALAVLLQENQTWIQSQQILAIPQAVIIALAGEILFVPTCEPFVYHEVEFKMNVGAV